MIDSKDLHVMDMRLQSLTTGASCSPELRDLIDKFGGYLGVIALRMAELEKENRRLNKSLIEINIG